MKQNQYLLWVSLLSGVAFLGLLNIRLGSEWIPWVSFGESFIDAENIYAPILWEFRLPKAFTAFLVGGSLGVSGLLMQSLFRNPMAGPFVLGISSGASLSVALMLMGSSFLGTSIPGNFGLVGAAFLGSLGVFSIIIWASQRIQSIMSLLIFGLMFGSFTGALVSNLSFFSTSENLQRYIFWGLGNLGGLNSQALTLLGLGVTVGLLLGLAALKGLNVFILGETYAQTAGVELKKIRLLAVGSCCLLTGISTAFVGPIGFVGLAVPHICRMAFRTVDHRILFPACFFVGGGLLLGCDIIAQLPGSNYILPINGVTSLLGAPVVIWLILKQRKLWNNV